MPRNQVGKRSNQVCVSCFRTYFPSCLFTSSLVTSCESDRSSILPPRFPFGTTSAMTRRVAGMSIALVTP